MKSRQDVQAALAAAERQFDTASSALAEARKAFQTADDRWIEDGSKRARESRAEASDHMDRAQVLHERAKEKLDATRAAWTALVRQERLAELATIRATLKTFGATVETHAAEFVAIDRAVETRVMALAVEVRDACEAHDLARTIAKDIGVPDELGPRPDLANTSLAIRRLVSAARQTEKRDALAPHWLSDAPDARDWRLRDIRAEDLAAVDRAKAHNLAIERDRVTAAAFAQGKAAATPTESTTTETKS